jgi:DNA-binding NarL/FixJ family response regulator
MCAVAAPIHDIELMQQAVAVVDDVVLLMELDFAGNSTLDLIPLLLNGRERLRVLVYTGYDQEVNRQSALWAGASGFLGKRESVEALFLSVQGAIDHLLQAQLPVERHDNQECYRTAGSGSIRPTHDHGRLIEWALKSHFKQKSIAGALGVSVKTVEHHSRRLRRQRE